MAKILFTGGGTAGHVTPNLALMDLLQSRGWRVLYIGSENGIERQLVTEAGVPYFPIQTGKLRRYFSWSNFIDPLRVIWGLFQSIWICWRQKPAVVFSKGGFVAVPVVLAAWLMRTPVIAHESDVSPGLATRLSLPFCRYLCVNFEESRQISPKTVVTGSPVRREIIHGDAGRGREWLGLKADKPVLLVFGGSLGAQSINRAVRAALAPLTEAFQLVHVCGAGNLEEDLVNGVADPSDYIQKEFIREAFGDVLACADVVIARAGANSIYELLLTRKPHLLIPLPLAVSRGDQLLNAKTFSAAGYSRVLPEEDLDAESLVQAVMNLWADREAIRAQLACFEVRDAVAGIAGLIEETAG
ncbi:MAG: undecaprenyldiphospho-muramoylpentapeptide beta-N-acetylglucosaminyltransferase [Gammaproteobacteria bacterium]|nr:undecaprenyldiphospho-muramoylpentapeptide beta-N-acetylglucosaminyltransferase [Gammaproteobacteria bacterium]